MGLRTYVLLHLVDDNRLIGVMSESLPEISGTAADSCINLGGITYGVYTRIDFLNNGTVPLEKQMLSFLTRESGSQENALTLIEAIEPLTCWQDRPVVKRADDGSVAVSFPRGDYGIGFTYLRVCRWRNALVGQQLSALATQLTASKPAAL